MNHLNSKVLGLATIALMSLMLLLQLSSQDEMTESELLLPELESKLSAVKGVGIRSLEDDTGVTLRKKDGNWIIEEKSGYPADFESLSELLNRLAELGIAEIKTAKAEYHNKLGVESSGQSAGTLISIEGEETYELIVGNEATSRGSFVRRPESDQVYLSDAEVDVSIEPMDYLDPVIVNVDSAEVQSITVTTSGSYLSAHRNEESGEMVIQNLPDGAELKYSTVADGLARMLINLRFTDVEVLDPGRFSSSSVATVETTTGEIIRVETLKVEDKYWLHLNRVETANWQYEISEYTYNELNKSMEDMLKVEETDDE
ncbi:MAG: DUF4340 domain-containing protein [Gammaproteobacteria bacterium]|jgi:hypothetical protein|nr:DUF4340 domain-containing protein [Gammaproteobacteria bacterium]MBT7370982.1 DUF4340 domain-containing protein [Gammaproteobacteria bacterium]